MPPLSRRAALLAAVLCVALTGACVHATAGMPYSRFSESVLKHSRADRVRPTRTSLRGERDQLLERGVAPAFKEKFYEQRMDHFNFTPRSPATFQQRFLVNDDHWDRESGPVFFYCGNEGDIEMFWSNTGFVFDIAPQFGALIVFMEHRYYGKSMPYGDDSFKRENVGLLTVEQALADYAEFLADAEWAKDRPVIGFGGSYGGMLAAWMRLKYPNVLAGAIAASAPILQFDGVTRPELFYEIISRDFAKSGEGCEVAVRNGFDAITEAGKTVAGRAGLTETFNLCSALDEKSVPLLTEYSNTALTYMAMTDYPYASDFLQDMPAWPVKVACSRLLADQSEKTILPRMAEAIGVYYNFTGHVPCYNVSNDDTSGGLGTNAWDYQACTEMVLPISSDGAVFPKLTWTLEAETERCQKAWGITPRAHWAPLHFGGRDISAGSNIVFSQGDLDPWYGGGVTESLSDTLVAIMIKDAAHHLDLRFAHASDTEAVKEARLLEVKHIQKWIAEYHGGK